MPLQFSENWPEKFKNTTESWYQDGLSQIRALNYGHDPQDMTLFVGIWSPNYPIIPEYGLVAYSTEGDGAAILIARDRISEPRMSDHFTRVMLHENNHIERLHHWKIPLETMGDAFVTEGLAMMSEIAGGHGLPVYAQITTELLDRLKLYALDHVNDLPEFEKFEEQAGNYYRWFFGGETGSIICPRYGGYALGLRIVESYLAEHKEISLAEATHLPASTFIDFWCEKHVPPARPVDDTKNLFPLPEMKK